MENGQKNGQKMDKKKKKTLQKRNIFQNLGMSTYNLFISATLPIWHFTESTDITIGTFFYHLFLPMWY